MLRNLENKGNPWGAPPNTREDWTKGLDFEVPRVGEGDDFEYLFWVGCAGAFEDRAKKTTRAVATLLHEAGRRLRDPRRGRDLHRRPGPPDRQRVRVPDAGPAERRDAQRGRASRRSSRPARTASTPSANEYGAARRRVRGRAPHPAAGPPGRDRQADPGAAGRRRRSPTTTRATWAGTTGSSPRRARCSARPPPAAPTSPRCRATRGALLLLRRRRRPDVDGGADRQADQRRAGRGGAVHRRADDRGRLPVLPRRCSATASPARRPAARRRDVEVVDVATVLLRSVKRR